MKVKSRIRNRELGEGSWRSFARLKGPLTATEVIAGHWDQEGMGEHGISLQREYLPDC